MTPSRKTFIMSGIVAETMRRNTSSKRIWTCLIFVKSLIMWLWKTKKIKIEPPMKNIETYKATLKTSFAASAFPLPISCPIQELAAYWSPNAMKNIRFIIYIIIICVAWVSTLMYPDIRIIISKAHHSKHNINPKGSPRLKYS